MFLLGVLLYFAADTYEPHLMDAAAPGKELAADEYHEETDPAWESEELPDCPEEPVIVREASGMEDPGIEEAFTPLATELNLAYCFPEGADREDVTKSYAWMAFEELAKLEQIWMGNIYSIINSPPAQIAGRLGRSADTVMGKYDPKDELQDPEDPDTWQIRSFKNIRVNIEDGDGQPISMYSNIIDLMSLTNVYTYARAPQNYEMFLSYAKDLWSRSHAYSVSLSEVYYCEGCIEDESEDKEEDSPSGAAESQDAATSAASGTGVSQDEIDAQSDGDALNEVDALPTESSSEISTESAAPTSPVIMAGTAGSAVETAAPGEEVGEELETETQEDSSVPETAETAAVEIGKSPSTAETEGNLVNYEAEEKQSGATRCPGHVDLEVNLRICGLTERNSLFALSQAKNEREEAKNSAWDGWTEEKRADVQQLAGLDWYEKYKIASSLVAMYNPLTPLQIEEYIDALPENLSQERENIIRFALSSVGKVPYYWGGKPSSPDYEGNNFGSIVSPDEKGRILRGLDCSGWISWVYWSATGKKLAYESTSGLIDLGRAVSESELRPGDILVKTGEDAHVIMFLGWTEDGRVSCIHESSVDGIGNVTIAVRDPDWPYCRNLLDD